MNKTIVICYNLLILGSILVFFFAFYLETVELSLKNILGSYLVIIIGILCNMALISRIKREVNL